MERLSWVMGPKCNHKCAYKTEVEGDLTTDKKGR